MDRDFNKAIAFCNAPTRANSAGVGIADIGTVKKSRKRFLVPFPAPARIAGTDGRDCVDEVQQWAESKRLSTEQINAAHLALSSDKAILAIEGFAGAAKTTTVGAVREFTEAHGYQVRAFAMTSNAVKELRKVGFDAYRRQPAGQATARTCWT
jgi:AAA domain